MNNNEEDGKQRRERNTNEKKKITILENLAKMINVNIDLVSLGQGQATNFRLPFDMIMKERKIICETDGEQHFQPVAHFNRTTSFEEV